jgi:ABC-type glycerol-3-phosphate transport system permease component
MPRYLFNTLVVAVLSIGLVLITASHAAYATARLPFRGREVVAFVILATSMVPVISLLTPIYAMWTHLGLHDTYLGVALVYAAWQLPASIWFIRSFVEAVPKSLEEAAMLDGCSRWQCFYKIIVPIIQPGLVAAAILVFIAVWNDFLLATTLTISQERRLIQVGFYQYIGDTGVEWGRFMAFAVVATLPIILMFVALRDRLLRGLVSGAMKG